MINFNKTPAAYSLISGSEKFPNTKGRIDFYDVYEYSWFLYNGNRQSEGEKKCMAYSGENIVGICLSRRWCRSMAWHGSIPPQNEALVF